MIGIIPNESKEGGVADTEDGVGAVGGSVADPMTVIVTGVMQRQSPSTGRTKLSGEASTVIIEDQDLSGF
jgi:hypothetical protein